MTAPPSQTTGGPAQPTSPDRLRLLPWILFAVAVVIVAFLIGRSGKETNLVSPTDGTVSTTQGTTATSQATSTTVPPASGDRDTDNGGGTVASDGGMIDLLPDGRSRNPRQSAEIVPSLSPDCPAYGDTGVNSTPKTFNCTIANGAVLISGGVVSTKYQVADGFLAAEAGPLSWSDTITDGFYVIKPAATAEGEWCNRFDQARLPQNSWLSNNLKLVAGWSGCSVQLVEQAKARAADSSRGSATPARVETGPKQVKAFPAGASVSGSVVCVGGTLVLNGDTPLPGPDGPGQPGCTGTRRNEVNTAEVFDQAGQVWNGYYVPAS